MLLRLFKIVGSSIRRLGELYTMNLSQVYDGFSSPRLDNNKEQIDNIKSFRLTGNRRLKILSYKMVPMVCKCS